MTARLAPQEGFATLAPVPPVEASADEPAGNASETPAASDVAPSTTPEDQPAGEKDAPAVPDVAPPDDDHNRPPAPDPQ